MVISSDTRVKRGAELCTDHLLVVSWIKWRVSCRKQTSSVGELGTFGRGHDPSSLQLPPLLELLAHPRKNVDIKTKLAKLKASIVEGAARSCDQKVIGAKYSVTSVI